MATSPGTPAVWTRDTGTPAGVLVLAEDGESVDLDEPVDFPLIDCAEGFPAEWAGFRSVRGIPAEVTAIAFDATAGGGSFRIERIRPISANQVLVEFSGEPGSLTPSVASSPLNADNWALVPLNPATRARLAQHVRLLADAAAFEAAGIPQLLGAEPPAFVVTFDGVIAQGEPYELKVLASGAAGGFDTGTFGALVIDQGAHEPDARTPRGLIDIANPTILRDAYRGVLGTYQVDETGDFALDKSEVASIRKRIVRRVVSAVNAFFHLPGYGAGIRIKALITLDLARTIEADVSAKVRQEPDVRTARVQLSRVRGAPNVIAIIVKAQTTAGPVDAVVGIQIP